MYNRQKTVDIVRKVNMFKRNKLESYELIPFVCDYFDEVKDLDLSESDFKFLKYISTVAGIPHYFDLLCKFTNTDTSIEDLDISTLSNMIIEDSLYTSDNIKLHKYQFEVLNQYKFNEENRFFLSASTSFGKTYLVYEVVKRMKYKNVVLIFPTIALLSENYERILNDVNFAYFHETYDIHTLSDSELKSDWNIFIFTPERYLSFHENNIDIELDFVFIDEVYKMDNEFVVEKVMKENERDLTYRVALKLLLDNTNDVLLAGPYIEILKKSDENYKPSFDNFIIENRFRILDYNKYDIVNKSVNIIKSKRIVKIDDYLEFKFETKSKKDRAAVIVMTIVNNEENAIVYCGTKSSTQSYAAHLLDKGFSVSIEDIGFCELLDHIRKEYSSEWIVYRALRNGIGIHHGLVPKYLQKEIIDAFNRGILNVLFSTTTITEGVNTSAKNMVCISEKKGRKLLKKFDAKNISGRAGRFNHHYKGRVIILQNDFGEVLKKSDEGIQHKNYDGSTPKDTVDLFITKNEYLTSDDKIRKNKLESEVRKRGLPPEISNTFRTVSIDDKILLYDSIADLDLIKYEQIKRLIRSTNFNLKYNWDDFEVFVDLISPLVRNNKLKHLVEYKVKIKDGTEKSLLTILLDRYIHGGFKAMLDYKLNQKGAHVNDAMREISDFVYNSMKYSLVKHLGVFSVIYRHIESIRTETNFDDVVGFNKLLKKLEYNALSKKGRLASDYGVTFNVLKCFEEGNSNTSLLDSYEKKLYGKVRKVVEAFSE